MAADPSVEPSFLLRAARIFLEAAGEPEEGRDQPSSETPAAGPAAQDETGSEDLGWEEAGCLVWDAAALSEDAAFLLRHDLPAMLPLLLTAAAAREQWRAVEIGLGVLGNLSCHAAVKQQLLQQEGLPQLILDTLLWVDDAASLSELCRCLASLLGDSGQEAAQRWWALLLREEALGRIVWIVENTLSSTLLERATSLLAAMVASAAANPGSGGSTAGSAAGTQQAQQAQLVPLLLSLDLLPLLASVLHGWVVRLRAEQQLFSGGSTGGGGRATKRARAAPGSWAAGARPQPQRGTGGGAAAAEEAGKPEEPAAAAEAAPAAEADDAAGADAGAEGGSEPEPEPAAAIALPAPDSPARWEEQTVAAAEVTEAAALEALTLLEALAAEAAGEAALNASGPVKEALLRTLAESEHHDMKALSAALLAGLEGVGPLLMQHPASLAALLARLADAAAAEAPAGGGPGAAAAEEAEAAWALVSALAHALSQQGQPAAGAQQEGPPERALAALEQHLDALCRDWTSDSLRRHQAYALQRLQPLMAPRLGSSGAAQLAAALERRQPGVGS